LLKVLNGFREALFKEAQLITTHERKALVRVNPDKRKKAIGT
jgi:hypothetical protein